jgi:hypothetical protein
MRSGERVPSRAALVRVSALSFAAATLTGCDAPPWLDTGLNLGAIVFLVWIVYVVGFEKE